MTSEIAIQISDAQTPQKFKARISSIEIITNKQTKDKQKQNHKKPKKKKSEKTKEKTKATTTNQTDITLKYS